MIVLESLGTYKHTLLICRCLSVVFIIGAPYSTRSRFSFTFNWPCYQISKNLIFFSSLHSYYCSDYGNHCYCCSDYANCTFSDIVHKSTFNACFCPKNKKRNKLLAARYDCNADDLFQAVGWHKLKLQRHIQHLL